MLIYMAFFALEGSDGLPAFCLVAVFGFFTLPWLMGELSVLRWLNSPGELDRAKTSRMARVCLGAALFGMAASFLIGIAVAGGLHQLKKENRVASVQHSR